MTKTHNVDDISRCYSFISFKYSNTKSNFVITLSITLWLPRQPSFPDNNKLFLSTFKEYRFDVVKCFSNLHGQSDINLEVDNGITIFLI